MCQWPFPPTGLTTACWKEIDVEWVWFHDLILTQTGVSIFRLLNTEKLDPSADDFCHVVSFQGNLYLQDGHHRVSRAAAQGELGMLMRVYISPEL